MSNRQYHNFPPLFDEQSQVLILGSFPSPKSREQGFFYGHPKNRFWEVLACVLKEPVPQTIVQKRSLALSHHIALWDVLESCEIKGAADSAIRSPKANDIAGLLAKTQIHTVFCTGAASHRLYEKLCLPSARLPAARLPSTSPANAAWSKDRLIRAYGAVAQALASPPSLL